MGANKRLGAAAVEFALISPLLFLLIFGMIEVGRVLTIVQTLNSAAHFGARQGIVDESDQEIVRDSVKSYLDSLGYESGHITTTTSLAPSANGDTHQLLSVVVETPLSQVTLIPGILPGDLRIRGRSTMRTQQ